MGTEWIIVADHSRARIFERNIEEEDKLKELQDFINTAGREENRELRTDGKGRFFGKGERHQGHTAEPNVTAKEHEAELFAKTLTNYLNDGRVQHRYSQLHIIAQPKFLGLIRSKLDKEVKKLVVEEIPKDLSTASVQTIEQYINMTEEESGG